jgi:type IV secretory pathway VirB6-like protein
MLRIKLISWLVILFALSSCDSSIMGSFLNWCWYDNARTISICYGNQTDGAGCGSNSTVTTTVTVNANGDYGKANPNASSYSQSAGLAACGKTLNVCAAAAATSAQSATGVPNPMFSTANNVYNSNITCGASSPFSGSNCNSPSATGAAVAAPVCDSTDDASYTAYCNAYNAAHATCVSTYNTCASAVPTAPNSSVSGMWLSTGLQVELSDKVSISSVTGNITLTQPLGLKQSGSSGDTSFSDLQKAYVNSMTTQLNSCISNPSDSTCDCAASDVSTTFCRYQTCIGYNDKLKTTDTGYIAGCDCVNDTTAAASQFCKYIKNASSNMASYANGGKGVLIPFYFDSALNTFTLSSNDPAMESVVAVSGQMAQGFGATKKLSVPLSPNQVLTFTIDDCGTALSAPYAGLTGAPTFTTYGDHNGWTINAQLQTVSETFITNSNVTPADTQSFTYQMWSTPIANTQCVLACNQNPAPTGSQATINVASTNKTYTATVGALYDPKNEACWHNDGSGITVGIGSTNKGLASILNGITTGTYTYTGNGGDILTFSFGVPGVSDVQMPFDGNQMSLDQHAMQRSLCNILAKLEPQAEQDNALTGNTSCSKQITVYGKPGSMGNGNRCYAIIPDVNDGKEIMSLVNAQNLNNPNRAPTPYMYSSGFGDITGFKPQSRFSLYCGSPPKVDADNCIDGVNLTNELYSNVYQGCVGNGGQIILRGYLGYSCCYKYEVGKTTEQDILTALYPGLNAEKDGLPRYFDIAGLVSGTTQAGVFTPTDHFNYVDSCLISMIETLGYEGGTIPEQASSYIAEMPGCALTGDFSGYTAESTALPADNKVHPGWTQFYPFAYSYDATDENRASLDQRRSCFPYIWGNPGWPSAGQTLQSGEGSGGGKYGCPGILGFNTATGCAVGSMQENNNVTTVCNYSWNGGDNAYGTVCCYLDNMQLSGDAVGNVDKDIVYRYQMAPQLIQDGPGGTKAGSASAANASEIIGGMNIYVKSEPVTLSNGANLTMVVTSDDPNSPPSGTTITPQALSAGGVASSSVGTLWLRINDTIANGGDGKYDNNTGAYNVTVAVTKSSAGTGIFGNLISTIRNTFVGALRHIYNSFTSNGVYMTYVMVMCEVYMIFTLVAYLLGIAKYNQRELITKLLKLVVAISCINPKFEDFILDDVVTGVYQGQAFLITAATGKAGGTGDNFDPLFMFNQVFDFFFTDPGALFRIIALFGTGVSGFILVAVILLCAYYYIFAVIDAIKAYIIAISNLAVMFAMAPIFIPFILFSKTKEIFDSWIKFILQYMLEPVLIFAGLAFLSSLMMTMLASVLSDGVCLKCVMNFIIGIGSASPFNNLMDLCLPGLLPWGFDNQGQGLISMYFMRFSEAGILAVLALIMKGYNKFINDIMLAVVNSGGRSVTGSTNYKNLLDGGSGDGGSREAFNNALGLNKKGTERRRGGAINDSLKNLSAPDDAKKDDKKDDEKNASVSKNEKD